MCVVCHMMHFFTKCIIIVKRENIISSDEFKFSPMKHLANFCDWIQNRPFKDRLSMNNCNWPIVKEWQTPLKIIS